MSSDCEPLLANERLEKSSDSTSGARVRVLGILLGLLVFGAAVCALVSQQQQNSASLTTTNLAGFVQGEEGEVYVNSQEIEPVQDEKETVGLGTEFSALQNAGKNCWGGCGAKEGRCAWCGSEGYCCRQGWTRNGCDGKIGGATFHACVKLPPPPVPALLNAGKDCWGGCGAKQGRCAWCGSKGYCCRQGWIGNGCDGKIGAAFHACVDPSAPIPELLNAGKDCWPGCGGKQGPCSWCGSKGYCCRRGWKGNGCDGIIGGAFHACVNPPAPALANDGKDCWSGCHAKEGRCSWCGTEGYCCRQGWKKNGCDGKIGGATFHACVNPPAPYVNSQEIEPVQDENENENETVGLGNEFPVSALVNPGKNCWAGCRAKEGRCWWCGSKGYCCRKGWKKNGCDGKIGAATFHACVNPPVPTKNLALKKNTWQSSTGWGGYSKRAVDGYINPHYRARSCTHTKKERHPFWAVDLGRFYKLSKIRLFNRFRWSQRLTNIHIEVSVDRRHWRQIARNTDNNLRKPVVDINIAQSQWPGRYVKVTLGTQNGFLTLCEVQIFGAEVQNVALRKPTAQISTGWGGVSGRANDGNMNVNYNVGSCTHTRLAVKPFWQVDLGSVKSIDKVIIYNRADAHWQRLSHVQILTSMNGAPNSWKHAWFSPRGYAKGKILWISFAPRLAKFVRVRLLRKGFLTLCEVIVFNVPGKRFQLMAHPTTWDHAKSVCARRKGALAMIRNVDENEKVKKLLKGRPGWIGVSDKKFEGRFEYVDGSPVTYSNWAPGEPLKFRGSREDCALMRRDNTAQWNDAPCKVRLPFVCSFPAPYQKSADVLDPLMDTKQ